MIRREDVSGVSGTGVVAVGVVLPDGQCVMQWVTDLSSTTIYRNLNDLIAIHGHGGRTTIEVLANLDWTIRAGQRQTRGRPRRRRRDSNSLDG